MSKVIYKSDYFNCAFSSLKKMNEQLQEMLDKYSQEGYKLHSYQLEGSFCSMIFYKEV